MGLFKKKPKKGAEADVALDEAPMPEAEGFDGEGLDGDAPRKKGLPLKLMVIGGLVFVLLAGGGGAGAYFFVLKKAPEDPAAAAEKAKDKKKKEKKKDDKGEGKEGEGAGALREGPDGVYFYTLPTFSVNMQADDGRPTFMKLEVIFEIRDEAIAEEIDEQMPRVQDTLQTFLRELRPEDLSGSAGTFRLRQELARRINLMIAPSKVDGVLLGDMLIT
jgi:flagellar protein FliL